MFMLLETRLGLYGLNQAQSGPAQTGESRPGRGPHARGVVPAGAVAMASQGMPEHGIKRIQPMNLCQHIRPNRARRAGFYPLHSQVFCWAGTDFTNGLKQYKAVSCHFGKRRSAKCRLAEGPFAET